MLFKPDASKPNEYFLLEYRQRRGYDQDLPAEGLLIWHIDLGVGWGNKNGHYRVELVCADGKLDPDPIRGNHAGDPFPGSTNTTSFTASLYDGSDPGIRITEISSGSSWWSGRTLYYKGRPLKYEGHEMSFHFSREGEKPAKNITVWPGDTNNDKIVNVKDVLPIGTYSPYYGPARYNYSGIDGSNYYLAEIYRVIRWMYANIWSAQSVSAWNKFEATYADANGDGIVNASDMDTLARPLAATKPILDCRL
ncbi:MAG: hypothetical protein QME81_15390, partial [bacterium]|nr:hypothetical protein [bacterium]